MIENIDSVEQLEKALNKYSNAAKILIENHFSEASAIISSSDESGISGERGESVLISMIKKYYRYDWYYSAVFDFCFKYELKE